MGLHYRKMKMDHFISTMPIIRFFFVITTCIYLFGCNEETTIPENNTPSNGQHKPVYVGEMVKDEDRDLFSQIKVLSEAIITNQIWNGFNLEKQRVYMIYLNEHDEPVRSFILNPHRRFESSYEIFKSDSYGMNIFVCDKIKEEMPQTASIINGYPNVPNCELYGKTYIPIKYNNTDIKNHYSSTLVMESAFMSQLSIYGNSFANITGQTIEGLDYTLNDDFIALQLLSIFVTEPMPQITNPDEIRETLAMYVSIRSKQIELDTSKGHFIINVANKLEGPKGAIRYISTMSNNLAYNLKLPFINLDLYELKDKIKNDPEGIKDYLIRDIWDNTGASAIYCLKFLGVDVETEIKNGKTPFEIADQYLSLSTEEKEMYIIRAKKIFGGDMTSRIIEQQR